MESLNLTNWSKKTNQSTHPLAVPSPQQCRVSRPALTSFSCEPRNTKPRLLHPERSRATPALAGKLLPLMEKILRLAVSTCEHAIIERVSTCFMPAVWFPPSVGIRCSAQQEELKDVGRLTTIRNYPFAIAGVRARLAKKWQVQAWSRSLVPCGVTPIQTSQAHLSCDMPCSGECSEPHLFPYDDHRIVAPHVVTVCPKNPQTVYQNNLMTFPQNAGM